MSFFKIYFYLNHVLRYDIEIAIKCQQLSDFIKKLNNFSTLCPFLYINVKKKNPLNYVS